MRTCDSLAGMVEERDQKKGKRAVVVVPGSLWSVLGTKSDGPRLISERQTLGAGLNTRTRIQEGKMKQYLNGRDACASCASCASCVCRVRRVRRVCRVRRVGRCCCCWNVHISCFLLVMASD